MLIDLALKSILASACSIPLVAYAIADSPRQFSVPAGDLARGLESLMQLSTDQTIGATLMAPPGRSGPDATTASPSTGSPPNTTADSRKEGTKDSYGEFLVTQGATRQAQGDVSVDKEGEQSSKRKAEADAVQEVIVTGSRIPTIAGQQVQPVQTYTREDIDQSGQTTVVDFLNTLPDVSTAVTEGGYQTFAGRTTVTLHCLPIETTLSLLNGQRLEVSFQGLFDLTSIPASAVERI
jgi:outer membrane receptor protein involved in Fe transport